MGTSMTADAFAAPAVNASIDASRLPWLLDEYLRHIKVSDGTKYDYRRKIRYFLRWSVDYKETTEADMDNFKHYLIGLGLKPTTQAEIVMRVGQMFKWAKENNYAQMNYKTWLPIIKAPDPIFKPVSPDGMQALLDACVNIRYTERAQAMIAVMAGAGLRLNEMVSLNVDDISFDSDNMGSINVNSGKNSKSRISGLLPGFGAYVQRWVDKLHTGPFLTSMRSERLHSPSAYVEFVKIVNFAGLSHVTPHDMRRFFATQWIIKHPGRLLELQKLLGHSDPATTSHYIWLTPEYMKAILRD